MLPPYNPDVVCPKCRCEHVSTRFAAPHPLLFTGTRQGHMERVCQRCRHGWWELPADFSVEIERRLVEERRAQL